MNDVRKIQGYDEYYRIRIGDYRLGIKVKEDSIEMLRCLHRKDIYKDFPKRYGLGVRKLNTYNL